MGSICSVKMSSEHLEIRSPIFGCIMDKCSSTCMKEQEQQPQEQPQQEPEQDVSETKVDINIKTDEPENK